MEDDKLSGPPERGLPYEGEPSRSDAAEDQALVRTSGEWGRASQTDISGETWVQACEPPTRR